MSSYVVDIRGRTNGAHAALVALFIASFVAPTPVRAVLISEVPLADLVAAADIVVVGGLTSTTTVLNGHRLTLTVDRVHKGTVSTSTIEVLWPLVSGTVRPGHWPTARPRRCVWEGRGR